MGVESEATLLVNLITTVLEDDRGPVDKVEQIFDLLMSPTAAWLAGKTRPEASIDSPYYVLFVYRSGTTGCYTNEAGSKNLEDITARAHQEIARGAKSAYVTQVIEAIP